MKNDYFSFFGIRPAFTIDEGALKRLYYQKSRQYHPDHFGGSDSLNLTDLAEFNNTAYQTISDFHKRTEYLIKTFSKKGIGSYALESDFLMEMLELNEQIDDLKASEDQGAMDELKERINMMLSKLDKDVFPFMKEFDDAGGDASVPDSVVEYFLKRKYLLRIQESLNTFANPNDWVSNE